MKALLKDKSTWIVIFSSIGVAATFFPLSPLTKERILLGVVILGGVPLVIDIVRELLGGELGADALASVAIIASLFLKQYLAGSFIVLMLATGDLLEVYAVHRASSVLGALLKRMPTMAHRQSRAGIIDMAVADIQVDDQLVIFPHEIAPVDGSVIEGHGAMDESFLTGEPFLMAKVPGSQIFSGAINGEAAITIRALRRATDSRYAKITEIMKSAEEKRPHLRRLADQLGAIYTPVALLAACLAWIVTKDATRFLAVIVVATPCPLIIAVPIAVIGSISLSARQGIIVKNPLALEQIQLCRTAIYDKTGTLTYGKPALIEQALASGFSAEDVLAQAASLEQYSKHPLAHAIQSAAAKTRLAPLEVTRISEKPGQGLEGIIHGQRLQIVGRKQIIEKKMVPEAELPAIVGGLECFVLINGKYAARYQFRDAPRSESQSFIKHLGPRHAFDRQMIVSGDRESEVRYLADAVGLTEVHAGQSPEDKLAIVRNETAKAKTLYIGDGINDAPALLAATVGMSIGQNSDVTSDAASVVVMDGSLRRVDEFMHISERMRRIALQCAVGGMILSVIAMVVASLGFLPPVSGAMTQEIIDLLAIANALRAAIAPKVLADV